MRPSVDEYFHEKLYSLCIFAFPRQEPAINFPSKYYKSTISTDQITLISWFLPSFPLPSSLLPFSLLFICTFPELPTKRHELHSFSSDTFDPIAFP